MIQGVPKKSLKLLNLEKEIGKVSILGIVFLFPLVFGTPCTVYIQLKYQALHNYVTYEAMMFQELQLILTSVRGFTTALFRGTEGVLNIHIYLSMNQVQGSFIRLHQS